VAWWWPRTEEQGFWTGRGGKRTQPEGLQEEELEMEAGIADDLQPVEPQVTEFGDGDSQAPVSQETPELPTDQPRR